MQRARAGSGRAAALARGCHAPLQVFSLSKDRAGNCRLLVDSLMPVLVTLSGNIFGGFWVLTDFWCWTGLWRIQKLPESRGFFPLVSDVLRVNSSAL